MKSLHYLRFLFTCDFLVQYLPHWLHCPYCCDGRCEFQRLDILTLSMWNSSNMRQWTFLCTQQISSSSLTKATSFPGKRMSLHAPQLWLCGWCLWSLILIVMYNTTFCFINRDISNMFNRFTLTISQESLLIWNSCKASWICFLVERLDVDIDLLVLKNVCALVFV